MPQEKDSSSIKIGISNNRVEGGRIYDKNWEQKGCLEGGKNYDHKWPLKGQIEEGKVYDKIYDPPTNLRGTGKMIDFVIGAGRQKVISKGLALEVGGNDRCFCGLKTITF